MKIVTRIIIGVAAVLATVSVNAQTNLNVNNTAPFFSSSNSPAINNATILVNDPVAPSAFGVSGTNNYANTAGTNYNGGLIYPFNVTRSLNVAFGMTITTTNSAHKGSYLATLQAGNGIGDWTTIAQLPVATGGLGTYGTNITVNVGGFDTFRVEQIVQTGESNYTATASIAFSSKPGL